MSAFSAPTCERAPHWMAVPVPDRQRCPLAERGPIQGLWHLHLSVALTCCSPSSMFLGIPRDSRWEKEDRESQRRGLESLGSRPWLSFWPQGTFSVGSWEVEIWKLEKLGFQLRLGKLCILEQVTCLLWAQRCRPRVLHLLPLGKS